MKAAILSLQSTSSKMMSSAMSKYFDEVADLDLRKIEINLSGKDLEILYEGKKFEDFDCVYARGSFRYAAVLNALTTALEKKAYMPIIATAFPVGHDKLLTQIALQRYKIPMPKTYLASSVSGAKKILKKVNYPIIMKFPSGTGGKGVLFAESFAAASSMMDALETLRQPFILQEYIETEGVDTRAIVVGNKVVASMRRKADLGEKRSNIHAGGVGKAVTLDADTQNLAIQAAHVVGAQVCAIDMLDSQKGPVVIEVNLSPGLQGITQATGIDVADRIAKFLYDKTKFITENGKKADAEKIMKELGVSNASQTIITNLDFRSKRILLPKVITDITKFEEDEELLIKAQKGKVEIGRHKIGKI